LSTAFAVGLSPAPIVMFPQAPLRSRTVGFPESGSDLGFPVAAFPPEAKRSRLTPLRPDPSGLLTTLVPTLRDTVDLGSKSEAVPGPPSAQSPFASRRCYLRPWGVRTPSTAITQPSSLLRTHASVLPPPAASVCKPCTAGLCRWRSAPAGGRTFPTLSLRIFPEMPRLLLRWTSECLCSFLPRRRRPSRPAEAVGSPQRSVQRLQYGKTFGAVVISCC
jgi:hypothetical protein